MKITTRFIETKPKWAIGFYYMAFALCLIVATPFVAMGIISEICVFAGRFIVQFASDKLNIEFTL